jgi:ATP-dependent DNA helicase RecQ
MINSGEASEQTNVMLKKLRQVGDFCQSRKCRRKYLLNYFDEDFEGPCNNCDICLSKGAVDLFDATIIAQKALSAVKRLKERFGSVYVINFLKGSSSAKIFEEHKYLPTFGKGNDLTSEEWKYYFNQLLEQNYLSRSDEFGNLLLTEKGYNVLYKEEKVMLIRPKEKIVERKERKERYAGQETELRYDHDLFEKLKALRLLIADSENVPAYLVFNDNSLIELAYYIPLHSEDLKHIVGFGRNKIEKYGKEFLDVIKRHCEVNKLQSRMNEKAPSKGATRNQNSPASADESLHMYQHGKSIEEIAKLRGLKSNTITDHLLPFITTGQINVLKFVSKEKLRKISDLIDQHGQSSLKIIKEYADDCSYSEIKAVVNYRSRSQSK